jgi:quercetin dioxygenase-like cupin family protein
VDIKAMRVSDCMVEEQDWGRLEWMVAGKLGNSDTLTVGKCFIDPSCANPPHYHPNCDEVLHVLRGEIENRVGDDYVRMSPGDTISIPAGNIHNARNVGSDEVECLIVFSSPDRQTIGEQ